MSIIIKSGNSADLASVKPASTAAVATDPALVVAISPNNSLSISGTVTSNIGTTNGLALDATLTGGTQKAIARGGAKGSTAAADITSTSVDANTQALHVALTGTNNVTVSNASLAVTGTFFQATQPVSIAASVAVTGPLTDTQLRASAVPISGTVTSNIGTTNGLALDATLTGGTAKTQLVGGATAKVLAASTAAVATDPALVVAISPNNSVAVTGTFFQGTQPVSIAASVPVTGTISLSNTNTTPLPTGSAVFASGTFTAVDAVVAAPDGTGTVLITGASTSGSIVPLACPNGVGSSIFLIRGLTAAQVAMTVYFEASTDSTNGTDGNWVDVKQRRTGTLVGVENVDYKTQANGYYRGNPAGFTYLRARILGTFSAGVSVNLTASTAVGAVFLNSGIPTGSSTIGVVTLGAGSASVGTVVLGAGAAAVGSVSVSNFPSSQAVTGPLTDTQLRASAVPVSGTVSANATLSAETTKVIGTVNVSAGQSITANAGTNLNTSALALDATLTGGAAKTIARTAAKGTTIAADLTSNPVDANTQALHVAITGTPTVTVGNASLAVTGTFFQGTQPVSIAASVAVTGALTDTQLRASAVPVSGTVTANATLSAETTKVIGTVNVSAGQSITANIGTTNGLALDATLAKLTVAQSAALGTNTLAMVGGSVTTAAPSYTTGNINPLSLTTAGLLRMDGSGVTQPVSGTVTSNIGTTNGLALDATLTGGAAKMQLVGGAIAKVLAASTAPAATDPALVVSISPNSIASGPADITASGALGALNAVVQVSVAGLSGAGFQLAAGTLIGTIIAEVSFDAGTTWNQTFFDDPTTSNKVASIVFGSANTATARTIVTAGGASLVRVRVSAFTSGTANITVRSSQVNDPSIIASGAPGAIPPPVALQVGGTDGANFRALSTDIGGRAIVSVVDGQKTTYSASATNITVAATATDVFTITGSATKTIRIFKIRLSGVQTTSGLVSVLMLKRSTANTAGTPAASPAVPHDSNNAAATATVVSYTANPTIGTLVGNIRSDKFLVTTPTATSTQPGLLYDFGNRPGQAIVLRGVNQVFALNLNGVTVTGGSFSYAVEWTEE